MSATVAAPPSNQNRSGFQRRGYRSNRSSTSRPSGNRPAGNRPAASDRPADKPEPKILFQTFFKSVGPRTYAAQVKEAGNGNHFLVLTEGKRDEKTDEIRKTRLYVFSEDFPSFFRMLRETAEFIRSHPVSPEVQAKRRKYWAKQNKEK